MSEHRRSWIQKNYRSFNGIRGVAILLVFVHHYALVVTPRARFSESLWVGVDLFFVLSGFLITGLLFDSLHDPDYYRTFYIRRALRIFPLYYGFFFLLLALTPPLGIWYPPIFTWSNLLYCENIARGFPRFGNPTIFYVPFHHLGWRVSVGPLWSLCVEEQFYLVWPFLLRRLKSRVAAMRFCVGAVGFTLVLRCALYFHNPGWVHTTHFLYFFTFTRCDNLFIGAWLALWLSRKRLNQQQLHRFAYSCLGCGGLFLFLGQWLFSGSFVLGVGDGFVNTVGYTLVGLIGAGVLLLSLDDQTAVSRFCRNKLLAHLGVISYGFYFLHRLPYEGLVQYAARHGWGWRHMLAAVVLILLGVIGAAELSFKFYESPFLRLKERFAPGRPSVPSASATLRA